MATEFQDALAKAVEPIVEEPKLEEKQVVDLPPVEEEPAVEDVPVEEPKVEEPVVEAPVEESKVEESPKVEEPKEVVADVPVEEHKEEVPSVEVPKVDFDAVGEANTLTGGPVFKGSYVNPIEEAPKVEEPKPEPPVEEPKVEELVEAPKVVEAPVEEPKVEEPVVEEPKAEEVPVEAPKTPKEIIDSLDLPEDKLVAINAILDAEPKKEAPKPKAIQVPVADTTPFETENGERNAVIPVEEPKVEEPVAQPTQEPMSPEELQGQLNEFVAKANEVYPDIVNKLGQDAKDAFNMASRHLRDGNFNAEDIVIIDKLVAKVTDKK